MRDPLMISAAADASQEMSGDLLKAAGAVMGRHGPDPDGAIIVATGFVLAIRAMDDIDHGLVRTIITEMLNKR